jgi:hypothetical protein
MSTLSRENRRMLENTVAQARAMAEEGARKVLRDQYAVHHHEPWQHMTGDDRKLRNQLRAHGRQLGDKRDTKRETQAIEHLVQACAYEHWHRMLFARFLAENDLLLDAENGVAMTLEDVRELAREQRGDWMDVAAELAQRMLLRVFSPDDPVLKIQLPPETRQQLEEKLASLPKDVFQADDSLGWVYQFWQAEEKERINHSGIKIEADELPAVTELFTEDYMVWFLLHNTLGAWWAAKRKTEGKDPNLPGYEWTYLRLKEDGMPAAGTFEDWPRFARDLKLLDPSMGSGHFLVFALPILVGFRMEEEGLKRDDAVEAVLRDNLFGLEIDPRCTQIAAFNLAWTAWRMVGYRPLPQLNLACSGLGINAKEEDWVKLAGKDGLARETMRRLYHLFQQAPILGSLIDPKRVGGTLFTAEFEKAKPLLERALMAEHEDETEHELAVAAKGLLEAARFLTETFTVVATNVPYVGRRKQGAALREYAATWHPQAKADLATCFVERCLRFTPGAGTIAVVTPQNWLFLGAYKELRGSLLKETTFDAIAALGEHAFESPQAAGAFPAAVIVTAAKPTLGHEFLVLDATDEDTTEGKAVVLVSSEILLRDQAAQLKVPDYRITVSGGSAEVLLQHYAGAYVGLQNGDSPRFIQFFWEVDKHQPIWTFFQLPCDETIFYGGRKGILRWEEGAGDLASFEGLFVKGREAWGKVGVAIRHMRELPATLYTGDMYDQSSAVIIPRDPKLLPEMWAFCSSPRFNQAVRRIDRAIKVTNATLVKVPFDLDYWRGVATKELPCGLPRPTSNEHWQWLFDGQPAHSVSPLQVSVARLLGYHWPRQTGSSFRDCPAVGPDGLEKHADSDGIVPMNAIAEKASATDRLRALLADAYGSDWSAAKLQELVGDWDSLEDWLRDGFFEEHCTMFHQRPFVWHIWDGRKDGFHALVNYHRLAGSNGEGRQTLEKLIYTYLGRWIERQTDEVRAGKEGADARLTAATHLRAELENILRGEKPYDIFVRWKPLRDQPIGWEPDINDGVRLNIRPWLTAKVHQPSRRDGCILRVPPKVPYAKDRGNEPHRAKEDFPWFWTWDENSDDFMSSDEFDGSRWNDLHYSLAKKKEAREKHKTKVVAARKA